MREGSSFSDDRLLRVYFACVGNSGRSQMAEAFAKEMGGDRVEAASGGSDPAGGVLDHVRTAMAEVGVSMLGHESTRIDPAIVEGANLVVTMGCGEDACPVFREVEVLDWDLEDPKELDLEGVRRVRDAVAKRVRELLLARGVIEDAPSWGAGPG